MAVLLQLGRQLNTQPLRHRCVKFIPAIAALEVILIPLKSVEKLQKFTLNFSGICERWDEKHLERSLVPKGLIKTVAFVIATSLDM